METPFFSILIPTYNKEQELQRCMDSALNQTYQELEIIVVDDGSTDGTREVLRAYEKKDSRVRLVENGQNRSLLYSRMRGMREAKGDYILLVDADDYLEKHACMRLWEEQKNNPCDILEFQFVREPSKQLGPWPKQVPGDVAKAILTEFYNYNVWHRCYSKEVVRKLLEKTEPFYCNMSEDGFFSVTFATLAKSYRRIPDVLYHYMVGEGMSTNDYQTKEQVTAAITSMQAKTEHLRVFLQNERQDLLPYVDPFYYNDLKKVEQLSTKDTVPFDIQMELLRHMDSLCDTNKAGERSDYILDALHKKYDYETANIRGKARILRGLYRRDVIQKAFLKLLGKRK